MFYVKNSIFLNFSRTFILNNPFFGQFPCVSGLFLRPDVEFFTKTAETWLNIRAKSQILTFFTYLKKYAFFEYVKK